MAVALQSQVDHRVEKGMAGREEVGVGRPLDLGAVLVESDARVAFEQRRAATGLSAAIPHRQRHPVDLVPAGLALGQPSTQLREGGVEEGVDVVGLDASQRGLVHLPPDAVDVGVADGVGREHRIRDGGAHPCGHVGLDDLVEPGPHVGTVAVADGVQQELPELAAGEHLAEHVVDLPVEGLAHLLDLLEQPQVHLGLAGVVGHEVPHVADLGLPYAVHPSEALLYAVRVPRQVVVHHQVSLLEVDALARRVGGHQHQDVRILGEPVLHRPALVSPGAARNVHDGAVAAEERPQPVDQVVESIAVLCEHDQLAAVAGRREHLGRLRQGFGELLPLGVGSRSAQVIGRLLEPLQGGDLALQLGDRLGGGGRVDDLGVDLGLLLGVELVVGVDVEASERTRIAAATLGTARSGPCVGAVGRVGLQQPRQPFLPARQPQPCGSGRLTFLCDSLLQPSAAAAKRLVDRLGRRRQAALQDRQSEADGVAPAAVTALAQPVGGVHLVPHILGDLSVEAHLGG